MSFRTRTHGTKRQIGKRFPVGGKKRLPKVIYPIKYSKPIVNVAITYLNENGVKKVVVLEVGETPAFYQTVREKGYTVLKTERMRAGGKARKPQYAAVKRNEKGEYEIVKYFPSYDDAVDWDMKQKDTSVRVIGKNIFKNFPEKLI